MHVWLQWRLLCGAGFDPAAMTSPGGRQFAGGRTDGDIRRLWEGGEGLLDKQMKNAGSTSDAVAVNANALRYEAVQLFNTRQVDTIVVLEDNLPIGILGIRDLVKMGLLG